MQKKRISINSVTKIVWKNILIIVITTILFGLCGALYAKHKKHTDYESVRNIMTARTYHGASANEEVQSDINLGKTYAKIIESRDVAKTAHRSLSKKIRKKYSTSEISDAVNASPVMQTTIIKVSAKANSAKDSASIVNAVTDAAKAQIHKKVPSAGKISLFAKAIPSEAQSRTSPSVKKLTLVGAAVGLLFGLIIAFSVTTWEHFI